MATSSAQSTDPSRFIANLCSSGQCWADGNAARFDDVEGTIAKMCALKAKGVGFSLDDFGTGFSSLSYLKRLPLDQVKIDRSFVSDLLVDSNDAAIAKTIVALADSMNLAVIAEGVETEEQREALVTIGCCQYQGYLFGRPLPLLAFEESVRGRTPKLN